MLQEIWKRKRSVLWHTLTIFLVLSFFFLAITFYIQINTNVVSRKEAIETEQSLVNSENVIITSRINRIIADFLYITDTFRLSGAESGDYAALTNQWLAFSNRKRLYDQIRFINPEGKEIVRVNYASTGAYITQPENLQNNAGRLYFTQAIALPKNHIYISGMDLNEENDKIQIPYNPVIRFSMPYYSVDGRLLGIIVLNYEANDIIRQVRQVAASGHAEKYMLNSDGYWLFNSADHTKQWGFMFADMADVSFKAAHPEAWETIVKQRKGYTVNKDGAFFFTSIFTSTEFAVDESSNFLTLGSGDWYIVSYISSDLEEGQLFTDNFWVKVIDILVGYFFGYIMILFISLVIGILWVFNRLENARVKYFSEYDLMTGAYNRRMGMEKLDQVRKNMAAASCLMSVCFLDINGLKEVNDTLGHDAGDELIQTVVKAIKENIRQQDFIARLGGDEFLIVFSELDAEGSESVWQRIMAAFEQINDTQGRKYIISVSHGMETIHCNGAYSMDRVINRADEKMYEEKRRIKQTLQVIRKQG